MASLALTDARIEINSVNLSAWVKDGALNYEAETLDETAMTDTTRKNKGGLLNWSASVTLKQDFASGGPDATLSGIVGTTVSVKIRPTSSSIGSTNPEYQGTGLIKSYNPIGNGVGDLATCKVEIACASVLTRATS